MKLFRSTSQRCCWMTCAAAAAVITIAWIGSYFTPGAHELAIGDMSLTVISARGQAAVKSLSGASASSQSGSYPLKLIGPDLDPRSLADSRTDLASGCRFRRFGVAFDRDAGPPWMPLSVTYVTVPYAFILILPLIALGIALIFGDTARRVFSAVLAARHTKGGHS